VKKGQTRAQWTREELHILDHFALAIVKGRYAQATGAVDAFRAALGRAGLARRHPDGQLSAMLRRRARALGRSNQVPRWTPAENRIIDRFAGRIVEGRYASTRAAVTECWEELVRARTAAGRTPGAVAQRLSARTREMGRDPAPPSWSRHEAQVARRFAAAVLAGRYPTVSAAVPDCRRVLSSIPHAHRRTAIAVRAKLEELSRTMGRPNPEPRWSTDEDRVLGRYARAVVQGKYVSVAAAVTDCLKALDRTATPGRRQAGGVLSRLRDRTRALGRKQPRQDWSPEENAVVDRFVSLVFAGHYRSIPQAVGDCAATLEALWHETPADRRPPAPHARESVANQMWAHANLVKLPRFGSIWNEDEMRIVDRYARAVIEHRYPSVRRAAAICHRALRCYHSRTRFGLLAPDAVAEVRPFQSVHFQVLRRAREIGRNRLPFRHWTAEEKGISARWTRRYDKHRQGRRRANLTTLAKMMQAELDRRGYYRGLRACKNELLSERKLLVEQRLRPARSGS
jgi:hypothetical protein